MCRSIKVLYNFNPPVTEGEVKQASLQFVRKISGFYNPSKINETAINEAVNKVAKVSEHLLSHLKTKTPKRERKV